MHRIYYWLVAYIGLILHSIYIFQEGKFFHSRQSKESHYNIVIGILSSREHFMQRNLLRNGIKKQKFNLNVFLVFIISQYPCPIPLEDRTDIYMCKPSAFLKPSHDYFSFHHVSNQASKGNEFIPVGPIGFDFIVNHEIVVGDLGAFDNNGDGFKGSLKVILYETHTKKEILSATFLPFGIRGLLIGMHVYKRGKMVVLPKGFHGSIVIEGSTLNDPMTRSNNCRINDGGGLITYIPGYRYGSEEGSFPGFVNNHINLYCYYAGPSFLYSSYKITTDANATVLANKRNERYDQLRLQHSQEEIELQVEHRIHNDLLFVNVIESYRNLSRKMLLFYEWLEDKHFDYVMKTDDDCYINLTDISHFMSEFPFHSVWVGNFRINFALDTHGKWAEHDYKSLTYPPFTCGSGYILSADIIHWIFINRHHLKHYQGEDVSLGIWLSAINPTRINDPRFKCFSGHSRDVFSSPDNNLSGLQYLYDLKNMNTT